MSRYMRADILRLKGSFFWPATLGVVAVLGIVCGFYVRYRGLTGQDVYAGYAQIINILVPVLASLFVYLSLKPEEDQGTFNRMLSAPSRYAFYKAKIVFWSIFSIVFSICCTLLFSFASNTFPDDGPLYVAGGLVAGIAMIPVYLLALFMNLRFSMGASIGIGSLGTLMGAVMGTTSIGAKIYLLFPWSYGSIASVNLGLSRFFHSTQGPTVPDGDRWITVLTIAIILSILMSVASMLWFNRWEGRPGDE